MPPSFWGVIPKNPSTLNPTHDIESNAWQSYFAGWSLISLVLLRSLVVIVTKQINSTDGHQQGQHVYRQHALTRHGEGRERQPTRWSIHHAVATHSLALWISPLVALVPRMLDFMAVEIIKASDWILLFSIPLTWAFHDSEVLFGCSRQRRDWSPRCDVYPD